MSDPPQQTQLDQPAAEEYSDVATKLLNNHDAFVFDMDGVLWRAGQPIPGAVQTIRFLREEANKFVFFATNNSTSSRAQFAEKFERMGFGVFDESSFYCTAWVAAEVLRSHNVRGNVLVLGTESLAESVAQVSGVVPVTIPNRSANPIDMDDIIINRNIRAVVVGFDPNLCYFRLAYATCILRETPEDQCLFIVTNEDLNFPSKHHKLPGNGSLVKSLISSVGRQPIICGKPSTIIAEHIMEKHQLAPHRVCMVGDNLLTDIAFGSKAQFTTLLVESGMHTRQDVKRLCKTSPQTHPNTMSPSQRNHYRSSRQHSATNSADLTLERMQRGAESAPSADLNCGDPRTVERIRERRKHEREDLRMRRRNHREESYEMQIRLKEEDEEKHRQIRHETAARILALKAEEELVREKLRKERMDFKERQRHEREESQERRLRLEVELEQIEERLAGEREKQREDERREKDELRDLRRREKEELKELDRRYREESVTRKAKARQEREELEERLKREREELREKYEYLERKAEEKIRNERAELTKAQRHRRSESQERHRQSQKELAVSIKLLEEQIARLEERMKEEETQIKEKTQAEKDALQARLDREIMELQRKQKEQLELIQEKRRREREESQERRRRVREESQERHQKLRREREEVREIHRVEKGVDHETYRSLQAENRERMHERQKKEELELKKAAADATLECLRRERQTSLERASRYCAEAEERRQSRETDNGKSRRSGGFLKQLISRDSATESKTEQQSDFTQTRYSHNQTQQQASSIEVENETEQRGCNAGILEKTSSAHQDEAVEISSSSDLAVATSSSHSRDYHSSKEEQTQCAANQPMAESAPPKPDYVLPSISAILAGRLGGHSAAQDGKGDGQRNGGSCDA